MLASSGLVRQHLEASLHMGLNVCFHSTCIYDEIGGQLSEIGAAFSGSFSNSDSDSEIATQQNDYRGSFRLQTLGRQVRVMSL